eukprot:TRINITY_DN24883_c0_g1_i1.p1 TRINITY_DN24883_c0_g1~~TRINITY_DN24883_c0_g1_i1.p1  ORF type:complete len:196 (+),score=52.15 TRINITY_DN24883_c0_g1_i1:75-662(+)
MEKGFLQKETTPVLTTEEIDDILKDGHELAGKTGSEVLILITRDEQLYSYTTKNFRPIVTERDGKNLIVKCLWDKIGHKVEAMVKDRDPNMPRESPEKTVEMSEKTFESIEYIEDEDERYEVLKSKFMELRTKFLKKTKPGNPKGEEGLIVVATYAYQMLTIPSPMFKPIVETKEGQELLQTLMGKLVGITPQKT